MVDDLLLRLVEAWRGGSGRGPGGWRAADEPVTVHHLHSSMTL
jgi:hypothetical protein